MELIVTLPVPPGGSIVILVPAIILVTPPPPPPFIAYDAVKAYDEEIDCEALSAHEAVPCKLPVKLPVIYSVTNNEPVTWVLLLIDTIVPLSLILLSPICSALTDLGSLLVVKLISLPTSL